MAIIIIIEFFLIRKKKKLIFMELLDAINFSNQNLGIIYINIYIHTFLKNAIKIYN